MSGFRLSPQQRDLFRAGGPVERFRVQLLVALDGGIDPDRLDRSLARLVSRYEILRTAFPPVPGLELPLQQPSEEGGAVIARHPVETEDLDDTARRLAAEALEAPMDAASGDLLRIDLVTGSGECHRLIWTQAALCGDATSAVNLIGELVGERSGEDGGEPLQYADLAEWLHEMLEGEDAAESAAHWTPRTTRPRHETLSLVREAGRAGRTQRTCREIDTDTLSRLDALAESAGAPREILLAALWAVLMARYTDQGELSIATSFDGRSYDELESAVGLFARYLPILIDVDAAGDLGRLVATLEEEISSAAEWQETFAWDRLETPEARPRHAFSYIELDDPPAGSGPHAHILEATGTTAGFDVELAVTALGDRLGVELRRVEARLDEAAAESLLASFLALCHAAPGAADGAIERLPLVDAATARALLAGPHEEAPAPSEALVVDTIGARADAAPTTGAVVCGSERLDYGELWSRAGGVAAELAGRGIGPGEVVAICCFRSLEQIVAILGVLRAGAAYLPLDAAQPDERLRFMLRDTGARATLFHASTAERVADLGTDGLDLAAISGDDAYEGIRPAKEDLAYVIYTSGSTGRPKGVGVTHGNLQHSTEARFGFYDRSPGTFLLLSSYAFDSSVVGLFWTLAAGGTLVVPEEGTEQDVGLLLELVRAHGVTHTLCLPALYELMLSDPAVAGCDSLSVVVVAGEACPAALARRHFETLSGVALVNEYGPTEAAVWALAAELDPEAVTTSVPIGRPIPRMRAHLMDALGRPVPPGVAGELWLAGEGVTRGYLHRPALTAERFVPDPAGGRPGGRAYRTGDRARLRADGQHEFLGRIDHQIKLRGYRIEPGEIESRLLELDALRQAVVLPRDSASGEPRLVAYFTLAAASAPTVTELRAALLEHLPEYMVPAIFVELDEMPLTPTGKVDRKRLPEPEQARPDLAAEYAPPSNVVETYLVARWQETLETDRVGVDDNFFELGGNSIQAAIFMNRLRSEIDEFVHVGRLFEHPTVRELATHLTAEHAVAIDRLGARPPQDGSGPAPGAGPVDRVADLSDEEVDSMLEELLSEEEPGA